MIPEPLSHLAAAVEQELARVRLEYLAYGMDLDLTATVDESAGVVVITGESLRLRRPRSILQTRISRAGLRAVTCASNRRIVVFPPPQGA